MMKMKKHGLYSSLDTNFKTFPTIFLHLDFSKTPYPFFVRLKNICFISLKQF